jgi:hypothetical protein
MAQGGDWRIPSVYHAPRVYLAFSNAYVRGSPPACVMQSKSSLMAGSLRICHRGDRFVALKARLSDCLTT